MSQQGRLKQNALETLTGDSGGPVFPDSSDNINIVGGDTTVVNGNPGTHTLTIDASSSGYPITPFVVGPSGQAGYSTIQDGLDAANAAGGGMVYVQSGTYTEDLTFYDKIQLYGDSEQGTFITGTHIPPSSGNLNIFRCTFTDPTAIFSSGAAGTTTIIMEDCTVNVTNGFTFDLLNWTGSIATFDIGSLGTNDGFINNTGGATCFLLAATLGAGTSNSMITSGSVTMQEVDLNCPWDAQTGSTLAIDYTNYSQTVTLSNNSTGTFTQTRFTTGSDPSITMSSSTAITLNDCVIDSTNDPAIAGTGAGTLKLTSITFPNNSNISTSLTISSATTSSGTFNTLDQADGLTITSDNITADGTSTNIDITITPKGSGGVVIPTNLTIGESDQDVTFTINGASIDAVAALHTSGASDLGGFTSERHSDIAAFGGHTIFLRTRGVEDAATIVADNDSLSRIVSAGYDGTDFALSTEIRSEIDGTPGNDDMPGRIVFCTSADGTQTPLEALRLDSSQASTFSGTVTISGQTQNAVPYFGASGLITETGPGTDGQLVIGATGSAPAFATLASADSSITITGGTNTLDVVVSSEILSPAIHGWNGSIEETADVTVTSDGATITCSVEQDGGGDLTVIFSDGFYDWDTTPADTVTLTAGTDASPQINYVYFLQSTKTLTVSTTTFPATEHAPIATVICQSAASLQTDGAYKVHVWTDHVTGTNDQGHIPHLNFWIRQQSATWSSGVGQTYTITPNGGAPDNVLLTTAIGQVLQLHDHTFPAFTGTPDYYVINDSATPYTVVTDLNALLTDSTGASMSGKYFSLILWGVVSEDTGDCKLFINLPSGSYNNAASVTADPSGFATFTIPSDYKGTGFLISQWNLRHQAASSGTWTSIDELDLRGLLPSTAPAGSSASATEFADNVFRIFDDGDPTKELAFEVSSVTTATTRTITMVDADLDLAEVATTFTADAATATPAANGLSIVGGAGISTSGAGSTVTITSTAGGVAWNEETGTSVTMVVDNGYIANNAGLVTLTLPATAALGDLIQVDGKGAGGWLIAQNAGQTVHFLGQDTTTGAGGSLASSTQYDCVTYRCITANTDWIVESLVGNLTVV